MWNLRRPNINDKVEVERIAKRYNWPMPERWEKAAIIENDPKGVIAFGTLRKNIEAIMMVGGTKKENSIALMGLMRQAIIDARSLGFEDLYVFAQNEDFADILEKHFKFRRIKTIPMILEFGE